MLESLLKMYKTKLSPNEGERAAIWSKVEKRLSPKRTFLGMNYKFAGFLLVLLFIGVGTFTYSAFIKDKISGEKYDDWKCNPHTLKDTLSNIANGITWGGKMYSVLPESSDIGFSTGGAKDINNFRENIENGYLPLPTDITYEGLFYDYYFDTGETEECAKLFCPSYSYAVTNDPVSDKTDYYLAVGLNSGMKESDFERKNLNLVVVLDISGSMSSAFDQYYYDQFGNRLEIEGSEEEINKTKMEIANQSVVDLIRHLNADDRFGMVLFDTDASVAKPLNLVGETDMEKIKQHILEIEPRDSTNMEAGMEEATKLFSEYMNVDPNEYENRIVFLTDAMPNTGDYSDEGLLGMTQNNSDNRIYTTFIGIGVDFNTELIESITKIRGANYYSVHSSQEFQDRMDEGFDYMVTPLVFNLQLALESQGYEIEKVYGSPEANEATGEIMKVNTLFPSKTEEGETKGGIVILKLKKLSDENSLNLSVSYEDRNGVTDREEKQIVIEGNEPEYFANSGIRKGVLLSRYADLMKNWIIDERRTLEPDMPIIISVTNEEGIVVPDVIELTEWERQSADLKVSDGYKQLFSDFKIYFQNEMNEIGDESLEQEVVILEKLINS